MAFVIITDSASDIPKSVSEDFGLHVIPTPVTIDETDYFDGDTIYADEFYRIQQENKSDIKTYHISQMMFYDHFLPYAQRGDEVLYICFSTGIAGTYQAAKLAKEDILEEYPDFQLTIVDSKCASVGFGLVVYKLLLMQRNGAPRELILEAAQYFCEHMEHVVTVGTLEYLARGGRLSKSSATIGNVLDIKPIIIVNEEGKLESVEKVRGMKRTLKRCIEMVKEKGAKLDKQIIGVCYGADPTISEQAKQLLQEECHVQEFLTEQVGCAIGAHTGPEILGIVFENALDERFEAYVHH
ncbi:MAG: DegV family protein [Lachnospiraceae bacterium]|nr:DegV family protein [Lachnospiraceae bacterium]